MSHTGDRRYYAWSSPHRLKCRERAAPAPPEPSLAGKVGGACLPDLCDFGVAAWDSRALQASSRRLHVDK
eukprot:scaffold57644_cov38-Prasinocladus_malaysianus.AAC.1